MERDIEYVLRTRAERLDFRHPFWREMGSDALEFYPGFILFLPSSKLVSMTNGRASELLRFRSQTPQLNLRLVVISISSTIFCS
jgi:hypothetical protein